MAGLFGSWDPCGKPEVVQQWRAALPQMSRNLQLYSQRGHLLEEHEPEAIARAIADVVAAFRQVIRPHHRQADSSERRNIVMLTTWRGSASR